MTRKSTGGWWQPVRRSPPSGHRGPFGLKCPPVTRGPSPLPALCIPLTQTLSLTYLPPPHPSFPSADRFGLAILRFQLGMSTADLGAETTISELDVLPIRYLFRSYPEMPIREQRALNPAGPKATPSFQSEGALLSALSFAGLSCIFSD
jgi:hypothetical protein